MSDIAVSRYLFERLKQLNVDSIFGLPGDFNLSMLDHINNVKGLRWIGNTNELNAGYAADGYSRVKRLSCLVTTFGVGELSALAAVAGSYSEHVGVVHVVGVPSLEAQNKALLLHHTLGNGEFKAFQRMSEYITKKAYMLEDVNTAASIIDKCIEEAYVHQRPVYIAVPSNLGDELIPSASLKKPLNLELPPVDAASQREVIDTIKDFIAKAKKGIVLVDACAARHDAKEETNKLIEKLQFPVYVTPLGKSVVDEHQDLFGGVYVGALSKPEVSQAVADADLVLSIGGLLSDFNTGSFTYHYSTSNIVEFHSDHTKIRSATYPATHMKKILSKLITEVEQRPKISSPVAAPYKTVNTPVPPTTPLSQNFLWTRLSSWFRPGDIIVTETGTSSFGITQSLFPSNTIGISQVLWGSIGYSVGAAMGAVAAAEELDPNRRVILFVGDGSLQLTVTEISTMVRWGLKPYLFILNNDGYTIERLIHGEKANYNDVHPWKYSKLLDLFNAKDYESLQVNTVGELNKLFDDSKFSTPSKIRSIEVFLPQMDAPEALVKQAKITASLNANKGK